MAAAVGEGVDLTIGSSDRNTDPIRIEATRAIPLFGDARVCPFLRPGLECVGVDADAQGI
jgi:hypothetical protein